MSSSKVPDSHNRVVKLQQEVEDVTEMMALNVQKELEREGKLSDLGRRAEQLNADADVFAKTAAKVKRKMWWQTTVAKIAIALIIVGVIFIVIIVPLATSMPSIGSQGDSSTVDVALSVSEEAKV